jgi:hypothetical protein
MAALERCCPGAAGIDPVGVGAPHPGYQLQPNPAPEGQSPAGHARTLSLGPAPMYTALMLVGIGGRSDQCQLAGRFDHNPRYDPGGCPAHTA